MAITMIQLQALIARTEFQQRVGGRGFIFRREISAGEFHYLEGFEIDGADGAGLQVGQWEWGRGEKRDGTYIDVVLWWSGNI
jgi:hypothetical protein